MNEHQMTDRTSPNIEYTPLEPSNDNHFENRQNFQKRKSKFYVLFIKCLLFIVCAALLYVVIQSFVSKFVSSHYKELDPNFRAALVQQQRGLVDVRLKNGLIDVHGTWTRIPQHFNQIWKEQKSKMDIIKLKSDGEEIKYFISFCPDVNQQQRKCTIVTFGVGHTVNAEQRLIGIYPECQLIAADPSDEINANLTQGIGGTFIHAPIGGESAKQQPVNSWGGALIERKLLTQVGIVDFMNNYTNWQHEPVDLLLIDIEGAEFGIFELLAFHYERFTGSICQINIEVHDPNMLIANYTHQQFFRSLDTLVRSGRFALMNTDMYTGMAPLAMYLRMFFVNVMDEKCTKKFLC